VSDSSNFLTPVKMWKYAAWAQDDWRITNKLTLNLGLRYDLIWNAFAQNVTFLPFELADRPQDANNIQPRLGFAYTLTDRTVLRGENTAFANGNLRLGAMFLDGIAELLDQVSWKRLGGTSARTRHVQRKQREQYGFRRHGNLSHSA